MHLARQQLCNHVSMQPHEMLGERKTVYLPQVQKDAKAQSMSSRVMDNQAAECWIGMVHSTNLHEIKSQTLDTHTLLTSTHIARCSCQAV